MWSYVPLEKAANIYDGLRKPVNSKERAKRIEGKSNEFLFPYYGATGQVGYIDDYLTDGEYVLLGEDGAPFLNPFASKAYVISGKAWVNNHAHILQSKSNNKFLCYYLNYFDYNGYVSGTTRLKLTQAQLKKIKIPNISEDEQQRIVSRIEELFSELDKGVETLQTIKEQLAVYRQAVLKEAFCGCKTAKAFDLCECITDGDHMPPPKAKTGIPFVMISNINKNTINWNSVHYVGEDYYNSIGDKRTPRYGDVLYTVTGSYGIPIKVDFRKKFCFQRHIALLRPNEKVSQDFLFYALQTPMVYLQATKKATGTAQKTVGLTVLRDMDIPFCESANEQGKIVKEVESRLSICESIEQTVDTALAQAEAMRQSILKKAFEGELCK